MNIQPIVYNPVIPQGVTFPMHFRGLTSSVPASFVNGKWIDDATGLQVAPSLLVPTDLTGKKIRGAMRKRHSEPLAAIEFSEDNGNVTLDPATGIYGINITPEATSALNKPDSPSHRKSPEEPYLLSGAVTVLRCSYWVYDIEIFDPVTGEVFRPVNGLITLTAEVTR